MIKGFVFFSFIFMEISMFCMEEEKSFQFAPWLATLETPGEYKQERYLSMELTDDNKEVVYRTQVPYAFVQQAAMFTNALAFQEEVEGKEIVLSLSSRSITIEQLKIVEQFLNEFSDKNNKKNLMNLVQQWYPNESANFVLVMNVAHDISHEDLLRYSMKGLFKTFQRLVQDNNWTIFFTIGSMIESIDVQEKLAKKLRNSHDISALINTFYVKHPSCNLSFVKIKEFPYALQQADIALGKLWIAALLTTVAKEGGKGEEHVLIVIDLDKQQVIKVIKMKEKGHGRIKISSAGDYVLVETSHHGRVVLYSVNDGERTGQLTERIDSFCFSHDGALIVAAEHGKIHIFDTKTLATVQQFPIGSFADGITISPNNQLVAFVTKKTCPKGTGIAVGNFSIEIWDRMQEKKVAEFVEARDALVRPLAFSPDNTYLAYGFGNGKVKIITHDANIVSNLQEDIGDPYDYSNYVSFAFSPNKKLLAIGIDNQSGRSIQSAVTLWNFKKHKIVTEYKTDLTNNIKAISFSRDGNKMALISGTDKAILYKSEHRDTCSPLKALSLHSLLLLWSFVVKEQKALPVTVPCGYGECFHALPKKIRDHFYFRNIELGSRLLPLKVGVGKSPIQFLKENRKKQGEKPKKKQRLFERFERDEALRQIYEKN